MLSSSGGWKAACAVGAISLLASCRGCLETDLEFADGTGGAPAGSTGTSSVTGDPASTTTTSDTTTSGDPTASTSNAGGASSSSSSSSTSTGESTTSSGGIDCPASDTFPGGTQSTCWDELNSAQLQGLSGPNEADENYLAIPRFPTAWWEDNGTDDFTGWLLFQRVSGAFVVSVHVQAEAADGRFQMAGLLLRDPLGDEQDTQEWIKWEIGRRGPLEQGSGGSGGGDPEVEYGSIAGANTAGDVAHWIPPIHAINGPFIGRLGICRDGDHYQLWYAADVDGDWHSGHRFDAPLADGTPIPQLPEEVQVGLIANAYLDGDFLTARFNDFVITREAVGDDPFACETALEQHGGFAR